MSARPTFQRSPRLLPDLPGGEREIPPPTAPPSAPAPVTALAQSIGVALVGAAVTGLMMYLIMRNTYGGGGSSWLYAMISLPVMVVSGVWQFVASRRSYQRALKEREAKYSALLGELRTDLQWRWQQQQEGLAEVNPEPSECAARAERLDPRLWERAPADPDFLSIRLGLGHLPFSITLRAPRQPNPLEPDPLVDKAQKLAGDMADVTWVPIVLPLRDAGAAGVVGDREERIGTLRSLCMQLATHHSPDEVKIVAVFPEEEAADWAWLRWLPHVWADDRRSRLLACDQETAHQLFTGLYDQFARRKLEREAAPEQERGPILPALVFVIAAPHLVEKQPMYSLLVKEGAALGGYAVIAADRKEVLPKECRAIAEVQAGHGLLITLAPAAATRSFLPDETSVQEVDQLARALAPVRLQQLASAASLPETVRFLELFDVRSVEELQIQNRWRQSQPDRTLQAPIGIRAGGELLLLDLHEDGHGPHGLIAGATGSGKSELLQSLIASMAIAYHPHDLTFVLVDFKGGALADDFRGLPHLVGSISNLSDGNMALRALAALRGELRHRQAVLSEAGVTNINDYLKARRQGKGLAPLPHLVFVIDEFAELKTQQPEFMRELVSAVRIGRSLGVHLILATQKPAGVVDDQIWGNARFRLCLRVERPEDSQEVLKRSDAAQITGKGRAFCQIGNNERFDCFQAAWSGAPYDPEAAIAQEAWEISAVALDGSRRRLYPPAQTGPKSGGLPKQLHEVVRHLAQIARQLGITPLQGPWLPPLPLLAPLDGLRPPGGWNGNGWEPTEHWLMPTVGLLDDPGNQRQVPLRVDLGREGHLVVYGAPGTGKTTLLQALVTALAYDHSPADLNLYILDFGGRSMQVFESLPHAGAVIQDDEVERINRLFQYLRDEMDRRKELLGEAGVSTLASYRRMGRSLPALVLVLENLPAFNALYPEAEDLLVPIVREGGNLGVHLVLSAGSPTFMRARLATNITAILTLQQAEKGDYSVVGRTGGLEPGAFAGRGLAKGNPPLEFQAAVPAPGATEFERSAALKRLIAQMAGAWSGPPPRQIGVLPAILPLSQLVPGSLPSRGLAVPVGLEAESLEPLFIDLSEGPHFLIGGAEESGKSTFLQTWLLSLAAALPPTALTLYLADFGGGDLFPLQRLPHVASGGYLPGREQFESALSRIALELRQRRQALDEARRGAGGLLDAREFIAGYPALVLALDDFERVKEESEDLTEQVEQLVRREKGLGFHLLLAGSASELANSGWGGLIKALKEMQTGFLFGTTDHGDLQLLNLRGLGDGKSLPAGVGFYGRRGRARKFKAASPQVGPDKLLGWIERIGAGRDTGEPDSGKAGVVSAGRPQVSDGEQ